MNIKYKPLNFPISELVPPEILHKYSEELLWSKFDPDFLWDLQFIRDNNGVIYVNDGKNLQYCGYRPITTNIGAMLSDHREWRAFDLHPKECSVDELYEWILNNKHRFRKLNCVEDIELTRKGNWVHISYRPNNKYFSIIR